MIRILHRSRSIHEDLLHAVCARAGLYQAAGLDVELADATGARWREASQDPAASTVAVGGVIADWVRGDRDWSIHFIATARPMMWVVGRSELDSIGALRGRRIATPGLDHMPTLFLRIVLERHGLVPLRDVHLVEVRHRPDRFALLAGGDVDAALLGPEGLGRENEGITPMFYLGAHVEIPTVGFAARRGFPGDWAAALAAIMAEGLEILRSDQALAIEAMLAVEPDVGRAVARVVHDRVIVPDWRGQQWAARGSLGDLPTLIDMLGVTRPPEAELRDLIHGWTAASERTDADRDHWTEDDHS